MAGIDLGGILNSLLGAHTAATSGQDSGAQIAADSKAAELADGTAPLPSFGPSDFINGLLTHLVDMSKNSKSIIQSGSAKTQSASTAMQQASAARSSGGDSIKELSSIGNVIGAMFGL